MPTKSIFDDFCLDVHPGISLFEHRSDCRQCSKRFDREQKYRTMNLAAKEFILRFGGRFCAAN